MITVPLRQKIEDQLSLSGQNSLELPLKRRLDVVIDYCGIAPTSD